MSETLHRPEVLLSIIIPSFNASAHIRGCLSSITPYIGEDLEVIVQDGKSTDDTTSIAAEYDFVKVIIEGDEGIYDAMNKGLQKACGRFCYFLGCDDRLLDGFGDALTVLRNENVDLLYGNVLMGSDSQVYDGEFDSEKIALKNICHQAMFYRTEVLKELGGFDLRYPILADYYLNLKLFKHSAKIVFRNLLIAHFSDTGSSNSVEDDRFIRDKQFILKELNYSSVEALQLARFKAAESLLLNGHLGKGIIMMLRYGVNGGGVLRSVYLILAYLKQRWTRG